MREIKFRGKRIDNGEWVYGCLTRYSDHMSYIVVDVTENNGTYQVLTETVGQYTGLKDKNGREIYEGDILEYNDHAYAQTGGNKNDSIVRHVVEYENGLFDVGGMLLVDAVINDDEAEVIGNIYENPRLLEGRT